MTESSTDRDCRREHHAVYGVAESPSSSHVPRVGRVTVKRSERETVCGTLAVDSVFATAQAEIKHVSRPRRPTQNKIPRSPTRGTSIGVGATPVPSVTNRRFPPIRIDGNRHVCGSGGPRLEARNDITRMISPVERHYTFEYLFIAETLVYYPESPPVASDIKSALFFSFR